MKKPIFSLLILLLCILFFACSDEGLEVKEPSAKISCFVEEYGKCYNIVKEMCDAVGGEEDMEGKCNSSSSSSVIDDNSSSSDATENSSSSDIGGSSSSEAAENNSSSSAGGSSSSEAAENNSSSSAGGSSSSEAAENNSSSSTGGSSSSDATENSSSSDTGNSSSSVVTSSSSVILPETTGYFYFRFFDYSSSSSQIYFLGTRVHMSDTPAPPGESKLFNTLEITDTEAQCGNITVEVEGGGLTTILIGSQNAAPITQIGDIKAYAVATCDGIKYRLRTATATVVPDPTFSDCKLPSTYVYKNEPVKDLVTIEDDYGRCEVTYVPATYPSSASSAPQNFSTEASITATKASVTCGPILKTCPNTSIIIADNFVDFIARDVHYPVNSGSTVIKMPITEPLQNGFGCEYTVAGGKPNIAFSLTVNGTKVNSVGNQNYWTDSEVFEPDYITNGNRILFETSNQGLECAAHR